MWHQTQAVCLSLTTLQSPSGWILFWLQCSSLDKAGADKPHTNTHKHTQVVLWLLPGEVILSYNVSVGEIKCCIFPFVHLTKASHDVNVIDITSNCILWKLILCLLNEFVSINQTLDSIKAPINLSILVKRLHFWTTMQPTVIWIHSCVLILQIGTNSFLKSECVLLWNVFDKSNKV